MIILASSNAIADDAFAVYFVRHADRDLSDPDKENPKLSRCGEKRAQRLATIFKDINLQAVYSTDFKRTQSTATPTAMSKNLSVESYDPYAPDELLAEIKSKKQDALIVGHNNTTNMLAGNLAGLDLEIIDENEYDRLYQVVVTEGAVKLQLLHQAFECNE